MKRVAVISAILEEPQSSQAAFNNAISEFKGLVKGRLGIPLQEENVAVVSIVVIGEMDEINTLNGKLGAIKNVTVKTSVSKKELP